MTTLGFYHRVGTYVPQNIESTLAFTFIDKNGHKYDSKIENVKRDIKEISRIGTTASFPYIIKSNLDVFEKVDLVYINKEAQKITPVNMIEGVKPFEDSFLKSKNGIIISMNMVRSLNLTIGSTITINNYQLKIVGVHDNQKLDNAILINESLFNRLLNSNLSESLAIMNYLELDKPKISDKEIDRIGKKIKIIRKSNDDFLISSKAIKDIFGENKLNANHFLIVGGIVSMLVILYSVLNLSTIMRSRVNQERYRIHILYAIGATRKQMFWAEWFQYFVLSLISSCIVIILLMSVKKYVMYNIGLAFKISFPLVLIHLLFLSVLLSAILALLSLNQINKSIE